jgi:hypothetical protein
MPQARKVVRKRTPEEIGGSILIYEERISELRSVLKDASDYIAYLISHLPEDKRDNGVWLKCQAALAKKP